MLIITFVSDCHEVESLVFGVFFGSLFCEQ